MQSYSYCDKKQVGKELIVLFIRKLSLCKRLTNKSLITKRAPFPGLF